MLRNAIKILALVLLFSVAVAVLTLYVINSFIGAILLLLVLSAGVVLAQRYWTRA